MLRSPRIWAAGSESCLRERRLPLAGADEIEIGFGKGRYLLARARAEPERAFLGIESAGEYYKIVQRRAQRLGLLNLTLIHGEAEYLAAVCLERRAAEVVHVYFPDPWPKARHHRRRLFDPASVDLVLGLIGSGGMLCFATDHQDYGESVRALLADHPAVELEALAGPWPDGARTHYESKYEREGRPILRLVARLREGMALVAPSGEAAIVGPEAAVVGPEAAVVGPES